MQSVSLCDELVFSLRDDYEISLSCDDPAIPVDETNLILKAVHALPRVSGVDIKLIKKIPVKGGLGGGSSNAAVTLLASNALWRLGLRNTDLRQIGSDLGADVPFFFEGGTAIATGTGTEVVEMSDVERQHLIVVTPSASVSTAAAYAALTAPSLTTFNSLSILSSSFTE